MSKKTISGVNVTLGVDVETQSQAVQRLALSIAQDEADKVQTEEPSGRPILNTWEREGYELRQTISYLNPPTSPSAWAAKGSIFTFHAV